MFSSIKETPVYLQEKGGNPIEKWAKGTHRQFTEGRGNPNG